MKAIVNLTELEIEIKKLSADEVLEVVNIYCGLRDLPKDQLTVIRKRVHERIDKLSKEHKYTLEHLNLHLFNIYSFLEARRSLCINGGFTSDWGRHRWFTFFSNEDEKANDNWNVFSKKIDLEFVKSSCEYSDSWIHCIDNNETELIESFNTMIRGINKNLTLANTVVTLSTYKNLWQNAYDSKKTVLHQISQVNLLRELLLSSDVMDAMKTDRSFFLFLFKLINSRDKTLKIVTNIFESI